MQRAGGWAASLTPILLLLVAGGAGYGVYAYRSRRALAPPSYSNIGEQYTVPPVSSPPAAMARVAAPTPTPEVSGATLKERMFAEQRAKYQARYTDALDEVTAASMVLTQMAPIVTAAQNNLQQLARSIQAQVQALLMARHGSMGALLVRAATFRPLITLFMRFGLLLKLVLGVVVFMLVRGAVQMIVEGDILGVLVPYLVVVAVLFFVERHLQLKVPLAALKRASDEFKRLRVAYIYDQQRPEPTADGKAQLHAVRVSIEKAGGAEEIVVPADGTPGVGPGAWLLSMGSLGVYRMEPGGSVTTVSTASPHAFMDQYKDLVKDALDGQQGFAASTLPSIAEYGRAMWRKHKASAEVPRLEQLVADVDRLEKVWRDTYVADDVFEFLLRRLDLFNMRDSATPPGLLLFGFPGNGRKHLAKKVAESISARFEQVNPSKLNSPDDIAALWSGSGGATPVVLFVPNADQIFPKSDLPGQPIGERTLEWLAAWEKHEPSESRVWVVMTAHGDQTIDRGILDHIGRDSKIEIKPPDAIGRDLILRQACQQHQLPAPPESVVRSTGGASIQELRRIAMAVKRASAPNPPTEAHWQSAIKTVRAADARVRDETKTWDRLVLPPAIKGQLQAACKILQDAPEYMKRGAKVPNFLLYGPPGTGKTEIARTIANEGGVAFFEAKTSDIKAGYTGQSAHLVKDQFAKARASAPAVLFIDEIESVAARRGSQLADQFTQDIVTEMLAQMDGAAKTDRPVFVLAATNLKDEIDPAILSRFTSTIEIPVPDEAGRREILVRLLREQTLEPGLDVEEVSTTLSKQTNGLSGRDLVKLVDRAVQQSVLQAARPEDVQVTRALLMSQAESLAKTRSDAGDEGATWDSLVLPEATLAQLKQMTESLKHMETLQKQGIDPPRGAVLFGPPGTGKTQIARTLRNESGVPVIFAGPTDIKAGYTGQSGIKVKELFERARRQAPCILFIDEFENGAAARGSDKADSFSEEIVTELLSQMDGAKKTGRPVFVLAATNHLERVDPAVLSRFTYKIEIPNPTPAQRQKLFTVFLNKYPHEPFDVDEMASELAKRAGDIGGRDIQGLVVRASQRAAQRAIAAGTPDRVLISKDDLLHQLAPQTTREISEADVEKAWAQIVLKPEVKASIVSKIRLFNSGDKAAPRGLLLYGPPGTGKTEIARRIAASAGCEFLSLTASDLKAGYTGQSGKQVKAVWDKARAYGRCIMFVDECEGVFGRRGGTNTDSFSEEVVREFLAMWDGVGSKGQVWVVGATNRRDQLDEAIVSRFGAAVEIGLPDAAERLQILALEMRKLERETVVPDFVGPATTGFAGRDLAQVARDVCTLAAETGGAIVPEHWRSVVGRYAKSTSDAVDERAKWESLILPEATVRKLKRLCEMLKHAETLQQQGIDPPRGALLFGPPGTGKTQIARTLANESGLAFIAAGPADIKGGYVGQSAIKVRELFERARGKAPAILFIDEIESGAASRDGGRGDQFTQDIVTELLTQMDGVKKNTRPVFVLAATNHPKLVDAAVVSRFEEQIEIPNPGQDERRRMIATFLGRQKVDFDIEELASEVSARTDGMSGRDLQSVVRRATQMALQRALDAGTPDRVLMQREDVMGQFTGFGH